MDAEKAVNWPIGRVATRIMVFTRESNNTLIRVLKMFHEEVSVIDPNKVSGIAEKFSIKVLPTIIFMWDDIEIDRIEIIDDI